MERLTETNNCIGFMETYLNVNCKECQYKDTAECEEFKDECKAVADFKSCVKNMYSKLKEYEDLEEQGKIPKLPCAVGDTVHWVNNWFVGIASGLVNNKWHITKSEVSEFSHNELGIFMKLKNGEDIPISDFGKTVFLTKESAEAALKEL